MILLLKYNNKTNICFFNSGFTFSVFILWFWLFCGFCTLILVGMIWFVIWWASGFLLRFDFGWILAVVVVVIWFWLGFGSGTRLEVINLKISNHGGLEEESSYWTNFRSKLIKHIPQARTIDWKQSKKKKKNGISQKSFQKIERVSKI